MNYITELNALYHFMLRNKLPKSEFALLTALYMINNAEDWVLWFEADNELLQRLTGGYSREAINTARNGLKQRGRIDFKPGKRNEEAAKYRIMPFSQENAPVSDKELDMKLDKKVDKELDMKLDYKTKQKQNRNKNSPPISPTESIERFLSAYPCPGNRHLTENAFIDCLMTEQVTEEHLISAAENYADKLKRLGKDKEIQFIKKPENFLRDMEYCQYLPDVYKPPQRTGKGNKFTEFQQNQYDFDALENELLSN